MDDAKPSLARRALAVLVLVVAAVLAIKLVIGAIAAVLWIVVLVAAIVAGLWAMSTLKSARRRRAERPARGVQRSSARPLPATPPEDRVDAELRRVKEQLREQGRL